MPYEGNSARHSAVATKAVTHGDPSVENGFPGIAAKTLQLDRFVRPSSVEATRVAVGESFEIQLPGIHEVRGALIPGGIAAAPVGTAIWIINETNGLQLSGTPATGQTVTKFGRVTEVVAARDLVRVNADARDTF